MSGYEGISDEGGTRVLVIRGEALGLGYEGISHEGVRGIHICIHIYII